MSKLDELVGVFWTLMPIHSFLVLIFVGLFSLAWSLAIGGASNLTWQCFSSPFRSFLGLSASPESNFGLASETWKSRLQYLTTFLFASTKPDSSTPTAATLSATIPMAFTVLAFLPWSLPSFRAGPVCFRESSKAFLIPPSCMVGVANSILSMPIIGTLLGWWGFVPADTLNLRAALEKVEPAY